MFRAILYRLPRKQVIFRYSSACTTFSARPNSLVGVGIATRALMHGPHPSNKISPACSFRGFMSIARKPKNPEDPNALKGDMLGVSLTERAIEVRWVCLSWLEIAHPVGTWERSEIRASCDCWTRWLSWICLQTRTIERIWRGWFVRCVKWRTDISVFVESNARVIVDSVTLALIKGSTIDYVTELIGSQFAIVENPQAKGSGCGCGVSWEPILWWYSRLYRYYRHDISMCCWAWRVSKRGQQTLSTQIMWLNLGYAHAGRHEGQETVPWAGFKGPTIQRYCHCCALSTDPPWKHGGRLQV